MNHAPWRSSPNESTSRLTYILAPAFLEQDFAVAMSCDSEKCSTYLMEYTVSTNMAEKRLLWMFRRSHTSWITCSINSTSLFPGSTTSLSAGSLAITVLSVIGFLKIANKSRLTTYTKTCKFLADSRAYGSTYRRQKSLTHCPGRIQEASMVRKADVWWGEEGRVRLYDECWTLNIDQQHHVVGVWNDFAKFPHWFCISTTSR